MSDSSKVAEATSVLSCLLSSSVVITILMFRKELAKTAYMQIVFYISFCDFISSVGLSGKTTDGSVECWMQGIFVNACQLSSMFWSIMLLYALYKTIVTQTLMDITLSHAMFCCGLPFLNAVLPILTNNYGMIIVLFLKCSF